MPASRYAGTFQFGQESCEAIPALYEPDPLAHLSLASVDQPAGGRISPSMQSDTGLIAPEQVIGLAWASGASMKVKRSLVGVRAALGSGGRGLYSRRDIRTTPGASLSSISIGASIGTTPPRLLCSDPREHPNPSADPHHGHQETRATASPTRNGIAIPYPCLRWPAPTLDQRARRARRSGAASKQSGDSGPACSAIRDAPSARRSQHTSERGVGSSAAAAEAAAEDEQLDRTSARG